MKIDVTQDNLSRTIKTVVTTTEEEIFSKINTESIIDEVRFNIARGISDLIMKQITPQILECFKERTDESH